MGDCIRAFSKKVKKSSVKRREDECSKHLGNSSDGSDYSSSAKLDGQARSSASVRSQSGRGNTGAVLGTIRHRGRSTSDRDDGSDGRVNGRAGCDVLDG